MFPTIPINVTCSYRIGATDVQANLTLRRTNVNTNEEVVIGGAELLLVPGESALVEFFWNETRATLSAGKYRVWTYAEVLLPAQDINLTDNAQEAGVVEVIHVKEDISGDRVIGLSDLVLLANAYDTHPGDAKWNPDCDLMPDNYIDIFDQLMLNRLWGWRAPNPLPHSRVSWPLSISPSPDAGPFNFTVYSDYIVYSDYTFNKTLKELKFNITSWIDGFCSVSIPSELMSGRMTVYLDDVSTPSIITWNATHTFVYFESTQLSANVRIVSEFALEIMGDLNHDGWVDIYDAILLSNNYNRHN
jgi:hypothetical protein